MTADPHHPQARRRTLIVLAGTLAASLAMPRAGWLSGGGRALAAAADPAADDDAAFMRRISAEPGVKTLPSGLAYKVLQSGSPSGTPPAPGDELALNYDGKLPDGATFDSTEQQGGMARMPFQGLIPGWMEGLRLMRPGDIWMLYIPSRLGYGDRGQGPIPPGSPLVFRIELIAVHRAG